MKLTDRAVRAAIAKARREGVTQNLREPRGRGRGALLLRAKPGEIALPRWYFTFNVLRQERSHPIGPYGDKPGEFTLEQARVRAGELDAMRSSLPAGDLTTHFDTIKRRERALAQEAMAARSKGISPGSLAALMDAYADALTAKGKVQTANDVRRLVKLHVVGAFPAYADAPAIDLARRQAVEILRRLVEAGKGRTAGKLRSYLRAAYAMALRAESDPSAPSAMLGFALEHNPLADVAALPQFNKTRDRALSESELRALWARLITTDTPSSVVIRLSLLLGGQRFNQLLRARVADFDADAAAVTLYDPKGRRTRPRVHVLPLPDPALALIKERVRIAKAVESEWLFPAMNGQPATTATVSKFLQPIRAAMVEANEARDFELADLRRTCETLLASLGVSSDIRAQIQSHGLGGVQQRHYDRHTYASEKRAALAAWARWLTNKPAENIVPMGRRRARAKAA